MKTKNEQILELLKDEDDNSKKRILLESAAKLGDEEWAKAVRELMKRMDDLNKS